MSRRAAERDKQREIERLNDKAFWEATARHWHDRAAFFETTLKGQKETTAKAMEVVERVTIESDAWRKDAEQHRADCINAERRSDALGDILDALKQGYQIEPFPGRSTWWTMDTDTLAQIAKDARDWQTGESEKITVLDGIGQPVIVDLSHLTDDERAQFMANVREHQSKPGNVVYMGKGEGEPFTMGGQEFKPEDAPAPYIKRNFHSKPDHLADHQQVDVIYHAGNGETLRAGAVSWQHVNQYRIAKAKPDHACIPCSTDNGPCTDPAACHIGSQAPRQDARDKMIAVIEQAYSQGMPQTTKALRAMEHADLLSEFDLALRFIQATNDRIRKESEAQAKRTATEPTKAEVEAEELIGIANHINSSMNGLPEEWEPWAVEIRERIRQVAHRLNQK
ncbi:TPA: hypothetical protein QHN36_003574 [Enterobacter bugandensis]|nr:hypothetical protein [Enterobacter bugandensis]